VPWAKLDDQIYYHPKMQACDGYARALNVAGITYCSGQLTDGMVPKHAPRLIMGMAGFTVEEAELSDCIRQLVDAGLWETLPNGYNIHDYLKYNPSRAQVLAERERNAMRQQEWRDRNRDNNRERNAGSTAVMDTVSVSAPVPLPVPERSTTPKEIGVVPPRKRREPTQPRPPAVEVYRDAMHRYPDKAQFVTIGDTVGADEAALKLWRQILEQWRDHGYNRQNLSGLLECFLRGGLQPRRNTREPPDLTYEHRIAVPLDVEETDAAPG